MAVFIFTDRTKYEECKVRPVPRRWYHKYQRYEMRDVSALGCEPRILITTKHGTYKVVNPPPAHGNVYLCVRI
jgi:hypothetical protein